MQLPVITFSGVMDRMAAGLQGAAGQVIDLTIGSVLRALLEASASIVLWLQWLILGVLTTTRAATSVGPDLDSWMADYAFARLQGLSAAGIVNLARYTVGVAATVPLGTVLLTGDGKQQFLVIEDDTNPAWNGAGGYTLGAGATSIDVPAACSVVGVSGNVVAGAIGLLGSPITGIDTVSNAASFLGGTGTEDDFAFRSRFLLYINSRSAATNGAILNAVAAVQQGLRVVVIESVDATLSELAGSFLVVVDDGTGKPGLLLLQNVQTAVDLVRPIGTNFCVQGPIVLPVSVNVVIETSNSTTHMLVAASVQAAIVSWIASLPIGGTLAVSKIDALAHDIDPSVMSVTSSLINGFSQDIIAPINGVFLSNSVSVS